MNTRHLNLYEIKIHGADYSGSMPYAEGDIYTLYVIAENESFARYKAANYVTEKLGHNFADIIEVSCVGVANTNDSSLSPEVFRRPY